MKHLLSKIESDVIYRIDTGSSYGCLVENIMEDKDRKYKTTPRKIERAVISLIEKNVIRVEPFEDGNIPDHITSGWFLEVNWRLRQVCFNNEKNVYEYDDVDGKPSFFTIERDSIDPNSTEGLMLAALKVFDNKEREPTIGPEDIQTKRIFLKKD